MQRPLCNLERAFWLLDRGHPFNGVQVVSLRGPLTEELLLAGLRRIPVDCQVALELLYWEKMTTVEMAAALGIPEGTVKSRLRRGRALLREAIEARASSPDLATSTLGGIETWARALRARAGIQAGDREK